MCRYFFDKVRWMRESIDKVGIHFTNYILIYFPEPRNLEPQNPEPF
ncbi:hypothetical protein D1AOALGA4SA_8056 [Olavius algarvensis Delta 1 endosymbiont]|nr:hypothetical protein D1AOALGA4SA_8056 [Olavius algarvensis Delta 1 endosymbiont]